MIPTPIVGSVKSFNSRLHPPLPLTPREADKLLGLLKGAFRKQLDKEHGPAHDTITAALPRRPPIAAISSALAQDASSTSTSTSKLTESRPRHTDKHVRAILNNPLFSYDRNLESAPTVPTDAPTQRSPMAVFDAAVAKGMMTPRRAAGCLSAVWRDILNSNSISTRQSMADSGAALRIIQWLRSSGAERNLSFISKSPGFADLLLKFMVAEGLEDVAWSWMLRLARTEEPAEIQGEPAISWILRRLIKAKTVEASSLDEGYESILRAENMLRSVGADVEKNLLPSWLKLSQVSTLKKPSMAKPALTLYERFAALGDLFCAPGLSVERAYLELNHPTHPSSERAEGLLHKELERESVGELARKYRAKLQHLGLDAAKHLQTVGKNAEAVDLLRLLRDRFGELVPPAREKPTWAGYDGSVLRL